MSRPRRSGAERGLEPSASSVGWSRRRARRGTGRSVSRETVSRLGRGKADAVDGLARGPGGPHTDAVTRRRAVTVSRETAGASPGGPRITSPARRASGNGRPEPRAARAVRTEHIRRVGARPTDFVQRRARRVDRSRRWPSAAAAANRDRCPGVDSGRRAPRPHGRPSSLPAVLAVGALFRGLLVSPRATVVAAGRACGRGLVPRWVARVRIGDRRRCTPCLRSAPCSPPGRFCPMCRCQWHLSFGALGSRRVAPVLASPPSLSAMRGLTLSRSRLAGFGDRFT
jgi:hypothetical protein